MEDSKPVLLNGNGTPYVAIFEGSGNPIMDDLNNIPIGMEVTSFRYKYTEGKGDEGEFVIETNYVELLDNPSLQYKMPLSLQWGWIFSDGSHNIGPVRIVVVSEHNIEYTTEGIKLTVKFKDFKKILEDAPSSYFGDQTDYLKYLQQLAMGRVGIYITDFSNRHGMRPVVLERTNKEDGEQNQQQE